MTKILAVSLLGVSKNYKIFTIAFAAVIVAFFSYWLIFEIGIFSFEKRGNNEQKTAEQNVASSKWIENTDKYKKENSLPEGGLYDFSTFSTNLTDFVSKDISSDFTSKIDLSSEQSSDDLLKQIKSIKNLNPESLQGVIKNNPIGFIDSVADSEIKISKDNSESAIKKYGQNYIIIFMQSVGSLDDPQKIGEVMLNFVSGGDPGQLSRFLIDLEAAFDKMKEMDVPAEAVDLHKKSLIFMKNAVVLFESIKNYKEDPLRAYMAMQESEKIISDNIDAMGESLKNLSEKYSF